MSKTTKLATYERAASQSLPHEGFVRQPAVLHLIPFSRSTLWLMVKEGTFPAPVKLSARVTAWRADDVRAFIASRQQ